MTLFLLVLFWGIWCTGHSGLITPSAQAFFRGWFDTRFRYFRLCYNCFAILSLVPVLLYSHSLQKNLLFSWEGGGMILWILLWGLVACLGYYGARAYDMGTFTGIRQAVTP